MSPPEQAQFDSNFLSGSGQKVDLSAFSNGNPIVAGTYRLDVYVNGTWKGRRDLPFRGNGKGDVDACLDLQTLEALGVDTEQLQMPAEGGSAMAADAACPQLGERIPNAFGIYDSGNLRYDVSIPQAYLRREARGYVNPSLWDRGVTAGYIGYTFNVVDGETRGAFDSRNRSAYLGMNMGLNLGGWQLRQDSNLTWSEGRGSRWQRISTYAQRGIGGLRGMLTVGESYTSGELFDSVSYRGINLTSDDRMLPDSLRGYAPVVRGIAETNARVEIHQNQQLIHSTTVSPGAFVIDDLYPTGYGGDLDVRVIEADGRTRSFKVPFGTVAQMLRPGMSRYAVTLGQVRNDSLLDEPWLAQATYQRGIGNRLTLYSGGVLSENYGAVLSGAGLATPLGAFSLDVTYARSQFQRGESQRGSSSRLSYSSLFAPFGTNVTLAAYRYSTRGYYSLRDALSTRDAISRGFDARPFERQRSQFQLTLNQPLGKRAGSLYVTGSVSDFYSRTGTSTQYQMGYNNAWRALNFGVSAVRTEEGFSGARDTQYLLSMSMPLGQRSRRPVSLSADLSMRDNSAGTAHTRGYDSSRIGIAGSAGSDYNINYGLTLTDSRTGPGSAVASVNYRGQYATLDGSYGYSNEFRQLSLGASGNVVVHAGGVTLAPYRGDTMVLVHAPGARGAHVLNAPGLRVDKRGYAVVPYVSPYRLNAITLDPAGMARDVDLESSSQSVAPYAGAISLMRFKTRSGRALLISVRAASGQALPLGASVKDAQGQLVGLVGQGGRLYVRSENDSGRLQIEWGEQESQRCVLDYQVPAATGEQQGFIKLDSICR
ncbi:fimbria/pilus outer membrane usher protein [Stenotrophomonas terrae]|uniref:fimbria/pilus outer membrane usher protein n=1 Tax=Stenotrophomonas terrae TaxID=405446 RepID=UPI001FCD2EB2|nr:fimbria/pilus outer membrane usher protein [Stenotrophomonas terrae]